MFHLILTHHHHLPRAAQILLALARLAAQR